MQRKIVISRVRRRVFQHVLWVRFLIILASLLFFVFWVGVLVPVGRQTLSSTVSVYRFVYRFVAGPSILAQADGRTNFLIMGVGGAGHEGPDLTDLMIFVSYNQKNSRVTVVSIPRDLWIGELKAKVNTAFHFGEEKQSGSGLVMAKSTVEEVLGQKIEYAAVVDFNFFKELIDEVGGVTVCVDRSFDDYKYPIVGKEDAEPESERYEHIHFDMGCQQIGGERALKFVRSRYAEGEEGTDFARSRRQQKVILAIKDKIISKGNLLNIKLAQRLIEIFNRNVDSDIPAENLPALIRMGLGFSSKKVVLGQLDTDDPETGHLGLLVNPPIGPDFDYQWVLVSKDGVGNWESVRGYIRELTADK